VVHGVVNGNSGPADNEPSTSAINRGGNFWTSLQTLEFNDLFGEHTFFLDGNGLNGRRTSRPEESPDPLDL